MALPAKAIVRPSRNPLRVTGTALPGNVLLMAKLIGIGLFVTHQVYLLPDPFLPFIPGLDRLMPGTIFRETLQVVFVISMVALFFNYAVRASCLLLGSSILLGVISSRVYYSNNMTLCALLLILAGLSVRSMEPYMLRLQVAVVYLGAGLNKALDPDWHSGRFFDHWAIDALHQPVYIWLHAFLPPLMLGKIACWFTIVAELAVSLIMLVPALRLYGASGSVLLQTGFFLFTGQAFGMFFFAMQAAALSFIRWPEKPTEVIYDGACGFCDWWREQLARWDFDKVFVWSAYQSNAGRAHGIADEAASSRLQLVSPEGKVLDGFYAVRRILAFTPAIWMALFSLVGITLDHRVVVRVIVAGAVFFLSPLANPIGVFAYDVVARNRHLLFPSRPCKVPEPSELSHR